MIKRLIISFLFLVTAILFTCSKLVAQTILASTSNQPNIDWSADFEVPSGEFSSGSVPRSIDSPQSGEYFVRYTKVAGEWNDSYADYYFGDHQLAKLRSDTPVDELYVQFYYRVSKGYWSESHQKVFLINSDEKPTGLGSNPRSGYHRRFQVYLELDANNQLNLQHSYIDEWCFFGLPQNMGGPAVSIRPDQWEKIKIYVKQNTPGNGDGIVRMWINDILKAEHKGLNLRGDTNYGMNKLIMSCYQGRVADTSGTLDFDNIKLSATDITD